MLSFVDTYITDSVDTKTALDEVRELIKASNIYISKHKTDKTLPNRMLLQNIAMYITDLLKVRLIQLYHWRLETESPQKN